MTGHFAVHVFNPRCHDDLTRHKHHYIPKAPAAVRCSCGHTKFVLNIGGGLPALVSCAKCGTRNRTATCHESGAADTLAWAKVHLRGAA